MASRFKPQTYSCGNQTAVAQTNREATKRPRGNNATRKPWLQGLNWDARYGDKREYSKKVAIAHKFHQQVGGVCVVCIARKATTLHHCFYGVDEELGNNYFPCCDFCHSEVCHHPKNWIKDKFNPCLLNRNTDEFVEKLRFNWRLLYEGTEHD